MLRTNLSEMVKYKDDAAKAYVDKLLDSEPKYGTVAAQLCQISDNIAIAFRKPTVWNVMFEDYYLPDKVRQQMSNIVAIFRHIENVYIIDRGTHQLLPVDTKPVPGNMGKTLKNRFKIYYDVLRSLSSDQLQSIMPIIGDLHKEIEYVSYQYPEVTCPKCGSKVSSQIQAPIDILFIRHQLQTILV
jgi:hypothetical protein